MFKLLLLKEEKTFVFLIPITETRPTFLLQGSRCEREATKPRIDPCLVNLCHSSSQCVANTGDDGYTCQCPAGRSGSLCEDGMSSVRGAKLPIGDYVSIHVISAKPFAGFKARCLCARVICFRYPRDIASAFSET